MTKKNNKKSNKDNDLLQQMLEKAAKSKQPDRNPHQSESDLRSELDETPPKERHPLIDGSPDLIKAIEAGLNQDDEKDRIGYPYLAIYGGATGNFEMIENGQKKTVPIEEKEYPLPLDTDIVKINAYSISTEGDFENIESIGNMILNAHTVSFESCYRLKRLPPMNSVNHLDVSFCYDLQTIHSNTRVREAKFSDCGIQFLPYCLIDTEITIDDCCSLKYIHPALSPNKIKGISEKEIEIYKFNYLLSDKIPDSEKALYPITKKEVKLTERKDLHFLPQCLASTKVILENCPEIKYIHPEIQPKNVVGIPQKEVCRKQMMWLFEKLGDSDKRFDRYFPMVRARMKSLERE